MAWIVAKELIAVAQVANAAMRGYALHVTVFDIFDHIWKELLFLNKNAL